MDKVVSSPHSHGSYEAFSLVGFVAQDFSSTNLLVLAISQDVFMLERFQFYCVVVWPLEGTSVLVILFTPK